MLQFEKMAKFTIQNHNCQIYKDFVEFLDVHADIESDEKDRKIEHGVNGLEIRGVTKMRYQLPTCLVITSNESVSSIEAQFNSLSEELTNRLDSINLILDERKCDNLKSAIEHIHSKLYQFLEITPENKNTHVSKAEKEESGDEVNLMIPEGSDSDEMEVDEESKAQERPVDSTLHVSTLQQVKG